LEGVFTGTDKRITIGILVARSKKKFTKEAENRAKVSKSNGYNIILTDEQNLYSDLIEYIESNRLDSSNNINLKNIELQLVEIRQEIQQLREELAAERLKSENRQ